MNVSKECWREWSLSEGCEVYESSRTKQVNITVVINDHHCMHTSTHTVLEFHIYTVLGIDSDLVAIYLSSYDHSIWPIPIVGSGLSGFAINWGSSWGTEAIWKRVAPTKEDEEDEDDDDEDDEDEDDDVWVDCASLNITVLFDLIVGLCIRLATGCHVKLFNSLTLSS